MRKENKKEKERSPHRDRYSFIFIHNYSHLFAYFRYLQANADRQEIWIISQLDGDTCNAFFTTAICEPETKSRTIYTASRSVTGYAEQY